MELVVQKFGGSSLANPEKIKGVARRVAESCRMGRKIVVVLSAMGDTTDYLLDLTAAITPRPSPREIDMLLSTGEQISVALMSMALGEMGVDAVSYTGWQAGIHTDGVHRKARIDSIDPKRINQDLEAGRVVVVTGFQGINSQKEITTLGRGGSDVSAVALAAALGATECEIYSDVDGVYTADPRVVSQARKLDELSYEEMLEMASLGAQVLQGRAVEHAKRYGVVIHARSTFSQDRGTLIKEVGNLQKVREVTGVAFDAQAAKLCLIDVPDRPGVAYQVFQALAKDNINVDMIIQSVNRKNVTDLCFTVLRDELALAKETAKRIAEEVSAKEVICEENVAKVSVIGAGMATNPGVAATMFEALAREKINIEMISTSEIKISCLISSAQIHQAVRAIHQAFQLGEV